MYDPSIWSERANVGRRQYVATVLTKWNGPGLHIRDLGEIIGEMSKEPIPPKYLADNKIFHGTRYRRLLSGDIDALNRDPNFRYSIISDTRGIRLCNRVEAERLVRMERAEAIKKLAKCSLVARKAGLDGQITITHEEINALIENGAKNERSTA